MWFIGLNRYPGTRPFEDIDSDRKLFFGREREKDELLQKIIARKLVVLHAESGLGKTSLLNAGVSALLRERGFLPIKVRFNIAEISPVQTVFGSITDTASQQGLDLEPGETETLWHYFKTSAFWFTDDTLLTPVLIFDQFEEFFDFHEPEAREEFIRQLADLVHNTLPSTLRQAIRSGQPYRYGEKTPRVKIVISIRSDFVGQLDELSSAIPEILDNRFRLLALTRNQARQAITGPAQIEDEQISTPCFRFSEDAVNTMLDYLSKSRERGEVVSKDEVESFQLQLLCRHIETNMWEKETLKTKKETEKFDFMGKVDFFRFTSLGSHIEVGIREKADNTGGQDGLEVKREDLGGEAGLHKVFQYFYEDRLAGLKPVLQKRRVRRLCEKGLLSPSDRRINLEEEVIERKFKVSPALLAQLVDKRLLRAEKRVGSVYYELSHDTLIAPIRLSQQIRQTNRGGYVFLILLVVIIAYIMILPIIDTEKQDTLFKEAEQLSFESKNDQAIEKYNKILKVDPKNKMTIVKLGELLCKVKRYEDAAQLYEKAIVDKVIDGRVYTGLLKSLSESGREAGAISYLKEAMKGNPWQSEVYEALADHYADKKEFKMAIENYEKVLAINDKNEGVYKKLAVLYVENGEKEKAIDVFKKAIYEDAEYARIYQKIRDVLKQKNDTETLETLYWIALNFKSKESKESKDFNHYLQLGNDYSDLKKYNAAISSYQKALELKPVYGTAITPVYENMGIAYRKKGDYDAAIDRFQKALKLKPTYLPAKENLAELYLIFERFDMAIELAHQVLKEKDVPQDQILAMKLIVISSLFLQGHQTQALMELRQLIIYYRGLPHDFKRDWDYSPIKKFLTKPQRLSDPTRALLLKLIDFLEAQKEKGNKILVELEKMVADYK